MAIRAGIETTQSSEIQRVVALLGGSRVLRHKLRDTLDVHEFLNRGMPRMALTALYENVARVPSEDLFGFALGISLRTFQRFKIQPHKPLSKEQSGRTWKFAEILARATEVFGSQDEAEQWLEKPAIGLEQRRPIELLATSAGVKLVEQFLNRIEAGVYA